jgi:hypothetical protein
MEYEVMSKGKKGGRGNLLNFVANRNTNFQTFMGLPVGATGSSTSDNASSPNGLGMAWSSGVTGTASVTPGGSARVNTRVIGMQNTGDLRSDTSFQFRHFTNPNGGGRQDVITITTTPWPGYRTANVTGATRSATNPNVWTRVPAAGNIDISFERCPDYLASGDVHISAIQARAQGTQGNWIEITNGTNRAISTRGLYLSDNWDERGRDDDEEQVAPQDRPFDFRWRLPGIIIRPGQTVFLRTTGSTSSENDAVKRMETNFGITFGERLRLAQADGTVLQRVEVSLMTNQQMQERGIGGPGTGDHNWRIVNWNGQRTQNTHPIS